MWRHQYTSKVSERITGLRVSRLLRTFRRAYKSSVLQREERVNDKVNWFIWVYEEMLWCKKVSQICVSIIGSVAQAIYSLIWDIYTYIYIIYTYKYICITNKLHLYRKVIFMSLHIMCVQHTDSQNDVKNPFEYVETKAAIEARYIGALWQNDTRHCCLLRQAAVST